MKKIMSLILAVALILTAFCGCSKSKEVDDNSLKYTVDTHYSSIDESTLRAFEKMCSAVENYETEVKFNVSMLDDVTQLFYTCFPLYPLVRSINLADDDSGIVIEYANENDEHMQIISDFKEKIDEIMTECSYGKVGTNQYLFNVYSYVSKNFSVDDTIVTTLDTLLQGKGISSAINSLFEYLILQGGGSACHVVNYSGSSTIISTAKFNNVWYYFDPATESQLNNGTALTRFGMDDDIAKNLYSTSDFTYTDQENIVAIEDNTYEVLQDSKEYTIDTNSVTVTLNTDGEEYTINFE